MNYEFKSIIENIAESDGRYKEDAYAFMMEALTYTQKKCNTTKHVSGSELLEGVKELLINKFGPMTVTVLNHWGIKSTQDFGRIVFKLIENKILIKTDEDSMQEFSDYFDFDEVFNQGYRKRLAKKISRMRSI